MITVIQAHTLGSITVIFLILLTCAYLHRPITLNFQEVNKILWYGKIVYS